MRKSWPSRLKLPALMLMASICLFMPPASSAAEGSGRQALTTSVLRVCADPENLPFSNKALQGFENRIVDLIGKNLGLEIHYTWYPQTIGFVRNTLRLRECDLISGITTTSERVQNTNPYYHSVYTMVYRRDSGINATSMSDAQLRGLKLGLVAGTPPASIVAQLGLMGNVKPYHLIADTRRDKPARQAILDVGSGETDVAFIWGPIAAYYAREAASELVMVPLVKEDKRVRLSFRISMAVRYNESDWKRTVNSALRDSHAEIYDILQEFDVPLLNDRGEVISE